MPTRPSARHRCRCRRCLCLARSIPRSAAARARSRSRTLVAVVGHSTRSPEAPARTAVMIVVGSSRRDPHSLGSLRTAADPGWGRRPCRPVAPEPTVKVAGTWAEGTCRPSWIDTRMKEWCVTLAKREKYKRRRGKGRRRCSRCVSLDGEFSAEFETDILDHLVGVSASFFCCSGLDSPQAYHYLTALKDGNCVGLKVSDRVEISNLSESGRMVNGNVVNWTINAE
jgi:hypothetical protein